LVGGFLLLVSSFLALVSDFFVRLSGRKNLVCGKLRLVGMGGPCVCGVFVLVGVFLFPRGGFSAFVGRNSLLVGRFCPLVRGFPGLVSGFSGLVGGFSWFVGVFGWLGRRSYRRVCVFAGLDF
jgi:hypothetical protein